MRNAAIGILSALLLSTTGAAAAAAVGGTYAETGSGSCVVSQAGFNADLTPIIAEGQSVGTVSIALKGTTTLDAASGTGSFDGVNSFTFDVIVPGASQPVFLGTSSGKQTIAFKYTTSTNNKGQTVVSVTPDKNGGEVNRIVAGTNTGDIDTISNASKAKGLVTSSGAIVMDIEEPSVATNVAQHPNGTSSTNYETCTFQAVLTPF